MSREFGVSLLDLGRTILEIVQNRSERRRLEEEKFKIFVLYVRDLKYYKREGINCKDIVINLNKIADYIKTYYGSELSTLFLSNLKEIYWALRYNSDISESIVECALEPFIIELKNRKIAVN